MGYHNDNRDAACVHAHTYVCTHKDTALNSSTNSSQWVAYGGSEVMSVMETVSLYQRSISYPAVLTDTKQRGRKERTKERKKAKVRLAFLPPSLKCAFGK